MLLIEAPKIIDTRKLQPKVPAMIFFDCITA